MARKSEQGFTLIEILVVLLITVILAAIALPLFLNQRAKGQDADAKASASVVAGAMEVYHQDHDSFAGADVDALAQIEPTVRQARGLDIDSDAVSYTLAVDSGVGQRPVHDRAHARRDDTHRAGTRARAAARRTGTGSKPRRREALRWRAVTTDAPWSGRRLHFVGIGGAGMSGLALVARELGAQVSGSDRSPDSPYLRGLGIPVAAGHDAANVPDGAEVVVSSAIAPDNPERGVAERELHRADLLGEITRLRPTIAVTGTHGKTTTSSMIVHALRGCGLDPGYLVGGEVRSTGSNAGWGAGEWLVVEADESDRSLLKLAPRIAVLTNAELDHHATYSSQRDVDETFRAFLDMAEEVVLGDEPDLARFRGTFARPEGVELEPGGSRFSVNGVPVALPIPGEHNARNAAAALAAAALAGAPLPAAAAALADFTGAGRRFETRRHHRGGRARRRRLRAPPDRGARHDRRRPDARAQPRRRRLPAAPVLAHRPPAPRVRRRARARRPRRRARRLPGARARRGLPGRDRPARRGGRRRRRARAPRRLAAGLRRRRALPARRAARRRSAAHAGGGERRRARAPPGRGLTLAVEAAGQ